jgi:N-acetylneuraminate synthase
VSIFIVAEIGINHNGDLSICKELIDASVLAGCDAVKFQKRDIDEVYTSDFLTSLRDSPWGATQRDQKLGIEFSEDEYNEIDLYCNKKGIDWYASAWDLNSQKFLRKFDTKYNKIASAMIVYEDLLHMVAEEGKYTFISTGMCTFDDIEKAISIFTDYNCPFELMHTVSTYPMQDHHANLKLINVLKDKYNCDVGYSGHEVGLAVSFAAAAQGITSLERHITINRAMYGSDQSASIEPEALRRLVGGVRKIEKALGNGEKTILDEEMPIAEKLRGHFKPYSE